MIIDLGAVSDSDADIMTALETIRFVDDHIRLIILSGARPSGYAILHQCFLNGIYNLIESTSDYIDLKNDIRKCITDDGMSYKDASVYRSEQKKQIKEVESVRRTKNKNKGNPAQSRSNPLCHNDCIYAAEIGIPCSISRSV